MKLYKVQKKETENKKTTFFIVTLSTVFLTPCTLYPLNRKIRFQFFQRICSCFNIFYDKTFFENNNPFAHFGYMVQVMA